MDGSTIGTMTARGDGGPATGVLARSVLLLRRLAADGERGTSLSEIVRSSGLAHATVHRLLKALEEEGLVVRITGSKRYGLGPLAFEIGLAAGPRHDLRESCADLLFDLAHRLRAVAYLCTRSGAETVCVASAVDGFRRGGMRLLEPGSRRPLGAGAAGVAILSSIAAGERSQLLESILDPLEGWGIEPERLAGMVRRARREGFALTEDGDRRVSAVAVPFTDVRGVAVGALSVAWPSTEVSAARRAEAVSLLTTHRSTVEARIGAHCRRP